MSFKVNIKSKSFTNKHDKVKVEVLKNVNIEIKSKEFVCIVGPSGCGKTTLMNIIGGLTPYNDNEEIKTTNNSIKEDSFNSIKEDSFGYVFQTSRLLPWLTVKENIELVCKSNKNPDKDINHLLSEFDLLEFSNYYPKAISGGMRRRVSLVRALINNPEVLLMDEPFVSLDQPTAENLYKVLIEYWKKKPIKVIFITHNLKEALLLSDRILFFSKRPATIVYDYKVKSKRGNLKMDNKDIQKEYESLNKKFPSILKGLV